MQSGAPTALEIARAVRAGERSAVEVLETSLRAIEAYNGTLVAFPHLDPDLALAAARQVDRSVAAGVDPGPLAGVPFGVKDLEDCAGMPTGKGCLLFSGRPPATADSIHVARLRAAGAVPVGKTAVAELGLGAATATRAAGVTRNPWDLEHTPGGSSGGSAAAVAGGLVPMATAADGGGSIRIPAAFCGLPGFKPSYGRIPHEVDHTSQTDVRGILATTVTESARHLDVAAGPDDRDRTSLPAPTLSYEAVIETLDVAGLRALWSVDLGFAVVDPEVAALTEAGARDLVEAAGLRAVPPRDWRLTDPIRTWLASGAVDPWMMMEPGMWPERADDLGPLMRGALALTESMTAPALAAAAMARARLEAEVAEVFAEADVVITPTTAVPAFGAGGRMPTEIAGRTVDPTMSVPFTMVANLCSNPAISLPCGLTSAGLPVGLQVMGRRHADEVVLRLGRLFELARPWVLPAPR